MHEMEQCPAHVELNPRTPVVSVIIPSYNSAPQIRQCLGALRAQSTELPFEVILLDSSNDGTERLIAEEFPEVTLFHFSEQCFTGTARNIGIEKAKGEVLLFLDADCIPQKKWISEMYEALDGQDVDGVCGSVENGTPKSITGSIGFYLEFFRFLAYRGSPYRTAFLMGGNSGFRKQVCRSQRYMDGNLGDDFLFSWQLAMRGKNLLFLPSTSVRHLNKTGLKRVLAYQYELGKAACFYRRTVSPRVMSIFRRFPVFALALPAAIIPWVGYTVLQRRGFFEILKFIAMVPLLLVAHLVWLKGFYRAARSLDKVSAQVKPVSDPHSVNQKKTGVLE